MLTDLEIKDIRIGFLVKKIHLGIEKNMTLCLKEKCISPQQGRIIIILYKNQINYLILITIIKLTVYIIFEFHFSLHFSFAKKV